MRLFSFFYKVYESFMENGAYIKLRHGITSLPKLFTSKRAKANPINKDDHIVVVGSGVAAFHFAKRMGLLGFKNLTIVTKDMGFGGKCVNWGCMPVEYSYTNKNASKDELLGFVKNLSDTTKDQFELLNYPIVIGEAEKVMGQTLYLKSGEPLEFDQLVLACGTGQENQVIENHDNQITLVAFWQLEPGANLVIVTSDSLPALSLADCARFRGINTSLVFTKKMAFSHLPSLQFFKNKIEEAGVKVFENAIVGRVSDNKLSISSGGQNQKVPADHIMFFDNPKPGFLPIDNKTYDLFDIDYAKSCISQRPDIFTIGDNSGLLLAAEAEVQAKMLATYFASGKPLDNLNYLNTPIRLHAETSMAWAGHPSTLLSEKWQQVDFSSLGWQLIHQQEGRLWYKFNRAKRVIEAIHICHPQAGDMIGMAKLFLHKEIGKLAPWEVAVHPSAAEIFSVMEEDVVAKFGLAQDQPATDSSEHTSTLRMPPLWSFKKMTSLPHWVKANEFDIGITSEDPPLYFGLLYGTRTLADKASRNNPPEVEVTRKPNGDLVIKSNIEFSWHHDRDLKVLSVKAKDQEIKIRLDN